MIPNSVKEIGVSAFENCTALENIVIPNSLEKINGYTFHNCKALTEIPASVQKVDREAFKDCVALKTVTFVAPSPVTGNIEFGEMAFTNTTAVIRYDGKGTLQNDEDYCVPAGNPVSDYFSKILLRSGKFTWISSSKSFEIKHV